MPATPRAFGPAAPVRWPRWQDRWSRPTLRLRCATESDLPVLAGIQEGGLRPFVEAYYPWDPRSFREHFRPEETRVLESARGIAGFYQIQSRADHLFLAELHVELGHRNHGLGELLLNCALAEAEAENLPLRLWVLRNNPARQLYLRLGFRDSGEGSCHLVMERGTSGNQTSANGPVLSPTRSTLTPKRSSNETYRFVMGLPR